MEIQEKKFWDTGMHPVTGWINGRASQKLKKMSERKSHQTKGWSMKNEPINN